MMKSITVYTTPLCVPCEALKRALKARGVTFRTVDLLMDEAAADRLEDAGVRGSPALEIDGRFYTGTALADDKLDALLRV